MLQVDAAYGTQSWMEQGVAVAAMCSWQLWCTSLSILMCIVHEYATYSRVWLLSGQGMEFRSWHLIVQVFGGVYFHHIVDNKQNEQEM